MSSKGGKDYIDPDALGARLGKKLSAHFDNGARQGVIQEKVDQRALAKKEVKKISNQIKNDRRKVQRLTAKAKYLTNKDLSQILEVRERRTIKKEIKQERKEKGKGEDHH